MQRSCNAPPWPRARLQQHAAACARMLLGHQLLVRDDKTRTWAGGRIVETEAYRQDDPACHAFAGKTPRNSSLFAKAGSLYVYRSYGIHWCVNIVCEGEGVGAAVLLRALAPTVGVDGMRKRRRPTVVSQDTALSRGPGNLCRAMGISDMHDGIDIYRAESPVRLVRGPRVGDAEVRCGPRIGITRNAQVPWRFWLANEDAVSAPRRGGQAFIASQSA